jgi:hypothetical protein
MMVTCFSCSGMLHHHLSDFKLNMIPITMTVRFAPPAQGCDVTTFPRNRITLLT